MCRCTYLVILPTSSHTNERQQLYLLDFCLSRYLQVYIHTHSYISLHVCAKYQYYQLSHPCGVGPPLPIARIEPAPALPLEVSQAATDAKLPAIQHTKMALLEPVLSSQLQLTPSAVAGTVPYVIPAGDADTEASTTRELTDNDTGDFFFNRLLVAKLLFFFKPDRCTEADHCSV